MPKKASGSKASQGAAREVEKEEVDDLGLGGEDDDEVSGISGSEVEDDDALIEGESGEEEDADEEEDDDDEAPAGAAAAHADGDESQQDDDAAPRETSRTLAKLGKNDMPGDMGAIKQRIHDDATLLGNWRKARDLGEKRSREEVFTGLITNCSTYFGYAEELTEYFLQMFSPEAAVKFFEANEQSRPLTIRTNTLKARRSTLMQSLNARKVNVDPVGDWTKVGLKVYESAVPVGATPEYLGGHYMIQSASSFIPVMALAPQQNETILDMAAAPGGKTTYIGQLMRNTGTLFANDLRKDRCKSLSANIHRLGLTNAVVLTSDGRKLKDMLPRLDRVLLDAPCSGSGIIARDPSVKVKRGMKDFEEISTLQKELLTCAIDMVDASSKTGGYIVYSTCSISVEENEAVIDHILKVRNVELVSFESSVNFGVEGFVKYRERRFHPSLNLTRRYLPHVHNMDGFYVAKLKKTSNAIPERTKKDRAKGAQNIKVWGEESWTHDMMESVADFETPESTPDAIVKKPMNKIERKKLKRQQQLKERAAAGIVSAAAAAAAAEAEGKATEPAVQGGNGSEMGKKKKKKSSVDPAGAAEAVVESKATKKTSAVSEAASTPAAEEAEKPIATKKKKRAVQKETAVTAAPAEAAAEAVPVVPKKKKNKAAVASEPAPPEVSEPTPSAPKKKKRKTGA